ncbi:protein transport protein Sec16A [Ctenodactylus gundi]
MQPPPQAVPSSGLAGPPPVGAPRGMFWGNSRYRRPASSSAPVAPACPLQPVTDPFAFSRQSLQNTMLDSSSRGSLPVLPDPAVPAFPQWPGFSGPHTSAGDNVQGPQEPLPGPSSQSRADASPSPAVSVPSLLPGPEMHRSAEAGSGPGPEAQEALLHLPVHVPGGGPDQPHGGYQHGGGPGAHQPLRRHTLKDGGVAPAASPFFPPPRPQMPVHWGLAQGSPEPSRQHRSSCPEAPAQSMGPQASGTPHLPAPSGLQLGPALEPHGTLVSPPAPSTSGGGNEMAPPQGGSHSASNFHPEHAFGHSSRVESSWESQELRQNPDTSREQLPGPVLVNPLPPRSSSENQAHCPPAAAAATPASASRALPEAASGALSMFFQGEETENEENLASERAGSAARLDFDSFSPGPGLGRVLPPAHGGGGVYQAFLKGPNSETARQEGGTQPHFSQSAGIQNDKQNANSASSNTWGSMASAGPSDASASQYENVENLEFVQNQEVLPSEPLSLDPSSTSEQLRFGLLTGPAVSRPGPVGLPRGGVPNLEAPDTPLHPMRSDSVSSSYSSQSHRSLLGLSRSQEPVGTFIQQEVGKPDSEMTGNFFKQIDSSPVGEETEEVGGSQNCYSSLSQPSTPSPPKPTGLFQTSANSSFEPVKSHSVGVKPVEADRANMVGEVRGTLTHQKKHRPAAALPDASPGNLEQPPDNMETLFAPQDCPLPLATTGEGGHGLSDLVRLTPEKRPSARVQGATKCESPATTLWAQNELPDFGGNVLLAPAAPALYVPAKPQPSEVVQPPEEGTAGQQSQKTGSGLSVLSHAHLGTSENLENPPKVGSEETLPSQAGSSYASLLSSPPAESLQNPPVLIAQPEQSYTLAQPGHFAVSLPSPGEKHPSWGEAAVGDRSAAGLEPAAAPGASLPNSLARSHAVQGLGSSEVVSNQTANRQPANLLVQPPSHPAPKNLLPESQKPHGSEKVLPELVLGPTGSTSVMLVPPANSTLVPGGIKSGRSSNGLDALGALDFTLPRTLENPARLCSPLPSEGLASQPAVASPPRQPGPGAHEPGHFYQQVTKDAQDCWARERAQPEVAPPGPQASPPQPPQMPQASFPEPVKPESPPTQTSAQPPSSPAVADTGQKPLPRPPLSSGVSVASTEPTQPGLRSEPPWLQALPSGAFGPPPQDLASYYYYRHLYDAYQPPYPSPYPPDAGTAPLCYQDVYGLYEPRYRPYDSSASTYAESYRCPEPERPSSRASHCSDRPVPRQGYPEGYYSSKSGWSSQSDYYANYYSGQYDYGDPGRWDRYYGSRLRDPRTWDRRYWYDTEYDLHRKESYTYSDRPEKSDDHWRYDPRFAGSFDDDAEAHRDPYGDEADRRSIHSEHSARSLRSTHSLPSRRSSLSSHSHQSQIYRSHNVTAGSFEVPPPPGSFHGDFAYGPYGNNFGSAHGFPEYGYSVDTIADAGWPAVEQVPSRPTSPEKFSVPHLCARFGPGGQLIRVIPNLPSEGQPALVEIHSMETLLQHTPEQEEMRSFPGPLGKDDTHKVDVINFAQNKAAKCLQNEHLVDKESASLLWNLIVLLCRQNGTVVGTDVAELLLRDHRTVWLPGKSPNEANLIDFTNEAVEQVEEEESGEAQLSFLTDSQAANTHTLEKETERFRELLLYGRKKDALESAMKSGLWGHALLLASKMDSRTHARVMTRFANSLPINDPLQTVYQLMSGRMPAASTCCGDEKWGDWRPHLAMVLSNLNNSVDVESRTMATMGDTLASKGLLDAAHFCYLMAQVGFGVYTKKTTKLVLIGSSHSLPFLKFATNEAIQRTEAYEYAQSLGAQTCSLPSFQVFKFIYSCRLAEMGLATQAFHYCEVIAKTVLAQPGAYSPVLISQLVQVASRLRLFDPQLKEKPEEEALAEPLWLAQLQRVQRQVQEGAVPCCQGEVDPQRCPSTPGSEGDQLDGPGFGQLVGLGPEPLLVPGTEGLSPGEPLLPSALQALPGGQPAHPARVPMFPVPPPVGLLELGPGCGPPGPAPGFPEPTPPDATALHPGPGLLSGVPSLQEGSPQLLARNLDPEPSLPPLNADPYCKCSPANTPSESWFSRWLPGKKRTEAYLPDDKNKSIVWDEKKNQWVDLNEPEEEKKAPPPPPTSIPRALPVAPLGPSGTSTASVNMFSRKAGRSRAHYVDVLNPGGTQRREPALAPADFFAPLAPLPIPPNLFVPNAECGLRPEDRKTVQVLRRAGSILPLGLWKRHPRGRGRRPPAHPVSLADAGEPQLADGEQAPAGAQAHLEPGTDPMVSGSAALPAGPELPPSRLDSSQGGELSRWSSVSSLSQEVSQHFQQAPSDQHAAGGPAGVAVPVYNPAQVAQCPTRLCA